MWAQRDWGGCVAVLTAVACAGGGNEDRERERLQRSDEGIALGTDLSRTGSIKLAAGVRLDAVALAATERLKVSDGAHVLEPNGTFATLSNTGTQESREGVQGKRSARSFSQAPIYLQNRAEVHGNATTGGNIDLQQGAVVLGTIARNQTLPAATVLEWSVQPPVGPAPGYTVESGQTRAQAAGYLGQVGRARQRARRSGNRQPAHVPLGLALAVGAERAQLGVGFRLARTLP